MGFLRLFAAKIPLFPLRSATPRIWYWQGSCFNRIFASDAWCRFSPSNFLPMNTLSPFRCFHAVASLLLLLAQMATAQTDSSPPAAESWTFTPGTVDISAAAQTVTIEAHVTDDLAGFSTGYFRFRSPNGQYVVATFTGSSRISGSALDGIYQTTAQFSRYADTGVWQLDLVYLNDVINNSTGLAAGQFPAGHPTSLTLTGTSDLIPPVAENWSFSPGTVDISAAAQVVTVEAHITDLLSGFKNGYFRLRSPNGQIVASNALSDSNRISGTPQDGIYQVTFQFPRYADTGTWQLEVIYLNDTTNNAATLAGGQYPAGSPTNLTVTGTSDLVPPAVQSWSFTPGTVNINTAAQSVTVQSHITDSLAGLSTGYFRFRSPNGQYVVSSVFSPTSRISGTAQDGIYEVTVTIPPYSDTGTWQLDLIYLNDLANNSANLAAGQYPAGYPASFNVTDTVVASRDLLVSNVSTKSILRFDGQTGAAKGTFVASEAGGLTTPQQMAIGPDGNLYVADATENTVKRYSILDGSFLGNFTPVGDLSTPLALKFFDDGQQGIKLFVLGGGIQRQIHRYNAASGIFEAITVSTTNAQISIARDFLFIQGSNDHRTIGSKKKGLRFDYSTGQYLTTIISSGGSTTGLNSPRNIIDGADNNIWISSHRQQNHSLQPHHGCKNRRHHQWLSTRQRPLSNAVRRNRAGRRQRSRQQHHPLPGDDGIPGTGQVFVAANSQGLSGAQFMLFAAINDPPVANAGADVSVGIGQQFTLNGTDSTDPEGAPPSYAWTQLSEPSVLPGPSVVSGSASTATLRILAPDAPVPLVFQLTVSDGVRTATDTVTVQVTAPPPETWRYQYFTSIYNTGTAADSADPDHDGLVNLLERAFNLTPPSPSLPFSPQTPASPACP